MQIKFLTLYKNKDNSERNLAAAQGFLLQDWYKAIHENNIKFISKAKLEFDTYSFQEYDNQEKLIQSMLPYYQGLKTYTKQENLDFNSYYDDMSKQYRLMELTITLDSEEEYYNDYRNSNESERGVETKADKVLLKAARGCCS